MVIPRYQGSWGQQWRPPGSCRPQMGPMLAPRTLLSWYMTILDREQSRSCHVPLTDQYHLLIAWLRWYQVWYCPAVSICGCLPRARKTMFYSKTLGPPYRCRKSHLKDKTVSWPSCLYNGNHYTLKTGALWSLLLSILSNTLLILNTFINVLCVNKCVEYW